MRFRKLDYNLNLTAKRLASGKTNSIGLYTPFETPVFRNYTYSEKITGIQDILYGRGFDIVLFSGGRNLYRDRPPITAIKWPYYEMGKKAATLLLENGRYKEKIFFETELIIRGSTDTRH